jgi:hypothetical protein
MQTFQRLKDILRDFNVCIVYLNDMSLIRHPSNTNILKKNSPGKPRPMRSPGLTISVTIFPAKVCEHYKNELGIYRLAFHYLTHAAATWTPLYILDGIRANRNNRQGQTRLHLKRDCHSQTTDYHNLQRQHPWTWHQLCKPHALFAAPASQHAMTPVELCPPGGDMTSFSTPREGQ